MTTEHLRQRLIEIDPSLERYVGYIAGLIVEAESAARREGIEIGRNQAAAERVTGPVPSMPEWID